METSYKTIGSELLYAALQLILIFVLSWIYVEGAFILFGKVLAMMLTETEGVLQP